MKSGKLSSRPVSRIEKVGPEVTWLASARLSSLLIECLASVDTKYSLFSTRVMRFVSSYLRGAFRIQAML